MALMQKSLENENPPSLVRCFQDLESTCFQRNSENNYCSHLKRLKKLVDMGQLDVNARYELGNTMLHFAAKDANHKALKLLLDHGADANIQNDSNETPLFLIFSAIKSSNERKRECAEILILSGADYDFVDSEGDTLVQVALKNGSFFSLQPIVAHLAWLKIMGLSVDERILDQINFVRTLRNYYRTCLQHLDEMKYKRIHEHVTEYDILTQSEEKIAVTILKDNTVIRKLEQYEIHTDYYFYNSLIKIQIHKAIRIKRLRIDAEYLFRKSIKLFQFSSHIIVDKIIGYLSNDDLHTLKNLVEEEEKEEERLNDLAEKSC